MSENGAAEARIGENFNLQYAQGYRNGSLMFAMSVRKFAIIVTPELERAWYAGAGVYDAEDGERKSSYCPRSWDVCG